MIQKIFIFHIPAFIVTLILCNMMIEIIQNQLATRKLQLTVISKDILTGTLIIIFGICFGVIFSYRVL